MRVNCYLCVNLSPRVGGVRIYRLSIALIQKIDRQSIMVGMKSCIRGARMAYKLYVLSNYLIQMGG